MKNSKENKRIIGVYQIDQCMYFTDLRERERVMRNNLKDFSKGKWLKNPQI